MYMIHIATPLKKKTAEIQDGTVMQADKEAKLKTRQRRIHVGFAPTGRTAVYGAATSDTCFFFSFRIARTSLSRYSFRKVSSKSLTLCHLSLFV